VALRLSTGIDSALMWNNGLQLPLDKRKPSHSRTAG
jgi:hypothetical protein